MRTLGFNPQQVGAVLQRRNAIEHAAVFARAVFKRIKTIGQTHRLIGFAALRDHLVTLLNARQVGYFLQLQEGIILVGQVTRFLRHRNFLRQTGTEAVRARHNHPIIDTQFEEGITHGIDF